VIEDPPPGSGSPTPTGSTRVLALLGQPVSHSLSPRMQNAALRALGLDGVYVALACATRELPGLLLGLARAGGGGNVTLPHKELAARTVEEPSPEVLRTGACNTFWMDGGVVRGDNTDVVGVRRSVQALLPGGGAGLRVLLLGAGGTARAAAVALLEEGAERVMVRNRTPDRGEALVHALDDARLVLAAGAPESGEHWDLVVNATSLGLAAGDPLAVEPRPESMGALLDLVYRAPATSLVELARSRGIPALDGAEMLLQQGMAAFRHWWGRPAPEGPMRAALGRPAPEPAAP
jgi:shikimate dehydrogenase